MLATQPLHFENRITRIKNESLKGTRNQTPNLNNHPYPYFAFTPSVVPFGTSISTPINAFQELHYSHYHAQPFPAPTSPSTLAVQLTQVLTSKRPWRTNNSKLNEVLKLLQEFSIC